MRTLRRVLDAVKLWHVVLVLLLGGFAEAIASALRWLVGIGWELGDVPTLHAFLAAGVGLGVEALLIYLVLRGLRRLLERRRGSVAKAGEPRGRRT